MKCLVVLKKLTGYLKYLNRDREEIISACFDVCVNFKYPINLEEFDSLLELFQRKREKNS